MFFTVPGLWHFSFAALLPLFGACDPIVKSA
jgi:hypothetical protein